MSQFIFMLSQYKLGVMPKAILAYLHGMFLPIWPALGSSQNGRHQHPLFMIAKYLPCMATMNSWDRCHSGPMWSFLIKVKEAKISWVLYLPSITIRLKKNTLSQNCRAHLFLRAHLIPQKLDFHFFFFFLSREKNLEKKSDQLHLICFSFYSALSQLAHLPYCVHRCCRHRTLTLESVVRIRDYDL